MTDLGSSIELRWRALLRRGPYLVLALATAVSAGTMPLFGAGPVAWSLLLGGAVAIAVAHRLVVDRRWGATSPGPDRLSAAYVAGRTAVAFVLTWVNPFFALFAFVGYFDAFEHVPRRWVTPVVLVTAVVMAGSQSGGLPPQDLTQALVFAGLLVLNGGLAGFFVRMEADEGLLSAQRVATIAELERTNARLAEALAENADLQVELVQRARDAGRHEERERLALEIHDTIAQSLVGVVTQLQAVGPDDAPAAVRARVERATGLARGALVEARRSVAGLQPAELDDAEVPAAIRRLAVEWTARTGAPLEVVVTGEPRAVPAEVEATLLRVAGEALANVDRHARARRVGLTLSFMADEVVLDVRDDGVASPARSPTAPGSGCAACGSGPTGWAGSWCWSPSRAGTAVSLRVPVPRG